MVLDYYTIIILTFIYILTWPVTIHVSLHWSQLILQTYSVTYILPTELRRLYVCGSRGTLCGVDNGVSQTTPSNIYLTKQLYTIQKRKLVLFCMFIMANIFLKTVYPT